PALLGFMAVTAASDTARAEASGATVARAAPQAPDAGNGPGASRVPMSGHVPANSGFPAAPASTVVVRVAPPRASWAPASHRAGQHRAPASRGRGGMALRDAGRAAMRWAGATFAAIRAELAPDDAGGSSEPVEGQ